MVLITGGGVAVEELFMVRVRWLAEEGRGMVWVWLKERVGRVESSPVLAVGVVGLSWEMAER